MKFSISNLFFASTTENPFFFNWFISDLFDFRYCFLCSSGLNLKSIAIVLDEKTTYNGALKGVVDEQTGKMIQAAAGILGTIAGKSADISKDDDYQTVLTFQCQAS